MGKNVGPGTIQNGEKITDKGCFAPISSLASGLQIDKHYRVVMIAAARLALLLCGACRGERGVGHPREDLEGMPGILPRSMVEGHILSVMTSLYNFFVLYSCYIMCMHIYRSDSFMDPSKLGCMGG